MRNVSYSVLLALSLFAQAHTASANDFNTPDATRIVPMVMSVQQHDKHLELDQSFKQGLSLAKYVQGSSAKEPEAFKDWMAEHSMDKPTALVELRQRLGRDTEGAFAANYAATRTQANWQQLQTWIGQQQPDATWVADVKTKWSPHMLLDTPPVLAKAENFIAVKNLVTESLPEQSRSAILFVGGVNDTYNFWSEHIREEKKAGTHAIFGYEGPDGPGSQPHNTEYLNATAQHLSDALFALSQQGIDDIQVIAHSLGGVVSKKALLVFEEQHGSAVFKNISFTAVSSPFGGYASADMAGSIPFFKPISKMFNIAMAPDMGPSSQFYQSISQPLSAHIQTRIIESPSDPVVNSSNPLVVARYSEVTQSFLQKTVVDGGGSHVYAQDPQFFKTNGVPLIRPLTDSPTMSLGSPS